MLEAEGEDGRGGVLQLHVPAPRADTGHEGELRGQVAAPELRLVDHDAGEMSLDPASGTVLYPRLEMGTKLLQIVG